MRLADEILGSNVAAWQPFAERLRHAVRFEIGPEVGAMAHAISCSNAARTKAAMEFCRLPFDTVWFEWIGPAAALGRPADDDAVSEGRPVPRRMGFLAEAPAGRLSAGLVSYAWSHSRSGPMICPLSTTFDWGSEASGVPTLCPDPEPDNEFVAAMRKFPRFLKDAADDLLAMRGRHGVVPCPHVASFLARVIRSNPATALQLFEDAWGDIRGEQRFVEALLATMNCRNLVQSQPQEDLRALNKARRKLGRAPRLEFRKVVISLSRVLARKAGASVTIAGLPLHIVRGHPKVRRTGIFWWSPFFRGDAVNGRVERTSYEVQA